MKNDAQTGDHYQAKRSKRCASQSPLTNFALFKGVWSNKGSTYVKCRYIVKYRFINLKPVSVHVNVEKVHLFDT